MCSVAHAAWLLTTYNMYNHLEPCNHL